MPPHKPFPEWIKKTVHQDPAIDGHSVPCVTGGCTRSAKRRLPEYLRMLQARERYFSYPGKYLHPEMQILLGREGNPGRARPAGTRADPGCRAPARSELCRGHVTTRDDLPDGGAAHYAAVVGALRASGRKTGIELLIPDFLGNVQAVRTTCDARPDVLAHNIETVPRLYPQARSGASYERSLAVLGAIAGVKKKTGLMLGLGETREELTATLKDILDAGCDILTLGQYLKPRKDSLEVERFVPPEEFDELRKLALQMGYRYVLAGPFIRSSYKAGELL